MTGDHHTIADSEQLYFAPFMYISRVQERCCTNYRDISKRRLEIGGYSSNHCSAAWVENRQYCRVGSFGFAEKWTICSEM